MHVVSSIRCPFMLKGLAVDSKKDGAKLIERPRGNCDARRGVERWRGRPRKMVVLTLHGTEGDGEVGDGGVHGDDGKGVWSRGGRRMGGRKD